MLVAVQLSVCGLYLPPVFNWLNNRSCPPQMIISLPVQTALWTARATGALILLVAVQLLLPGLYRPPVLKSPVSLNPPQMIISLPVQTAV